MPSPKSILYVSASPLASVELRPSTYTVDAVVATCKFATGRVFGPSELDELDRLELERLQLTLDELAELDGSELDELIERLEKLLDVLLDGGTNDELLAELLEELIAELLEELLKLLGWFAQTAPPIDGRCAGLLATPLLPCTPNSMD